MAKILDYFVIVYQKIFSSFFCGACRFYPSCSEYFRGVLKKRSFWEAVFLGSKRILKCHPYHPGGIDLP